MVRKIRQGPVIQMDETRVQVMKEPGRSNTKNSYMWPARGGWFRYFRDFGRWLEDKAPKVRPSSVLGKAVSYARGQWERVSRFVESPYLTPDNNAAERAIRPFVVGRKNWIFSGSPRGADASWFFYSLIETAKANNLNPYDYLTWIFKTAPRLLKAQYENLLPWKVDRQAVKRAAVKSWRN